MSVWNNPEDYDSEPGAAERRALAQLLEGAAMNQAQIDLPAYRRFRSAILRNSLRLAEPQPEADLRDAVGSIVHEFEHHRSVCETTIEARAKEWRHMTSMLMHFLAEREEVDRDSDLWNGICRRLGSATSEEEVVALRIKLQRLFQRSHEDALAKQTALRDEQDRSVANDNAAGLRGGGAAIQHFQEMTSASRPGFIALFRMSCLDVVGERFGDEGIQDCLMAVSAFLIHNMRPEDTVYHWSESSLLAICDRKVRQDIVTAELNRMLARNRDFTIKIGDRMIMLRIPVDLRIFPVDHFSSVEELQKLAMERPQIDKALVR